MAEETLSGSVAIVTGAAHFSLTTLDARGFRLRVS